MSESSQGISKPLLGDRAYDILKQVTLILLPAVGALYVSLAQIWNFPNGEKVAGTVAALGMCIGVLLKISTTSYNKSDAKYAGEIDVVEDDDRTLYSLNLNGNVDALKTLGEVTFKVNGQ